ncbi:MAG: hypothetical protein WDA60_12350 [Acidimicrobiia bacterium]|jgi:hypothetical protein
MSTGLATHHDPATERELATIALVDAALSAASHREIFTREEATQLLHDVR